MEYEIDWVIALNNYLPLHRAVSGEGITYYPRQNGGDWKVDLDGFESNCPVSNVHELAIATHAISNNFTTCMET